MFDEGREGGREGEREGRRKGRERETEREKRDFWFHFQYVKSLEVIAPILTTRKKLNKVIINDVS